LAGAVLPYITSGAAPIVDFLGAGQACQSECTKGKGYFVQIGYHNIFLFGIKAALLRAYKTYASGSVHQNSVTAIVPQHNGISSGEVRQTNTIFTLLI
jgi:hypothetical protein